MDETLAIRVRSVSGSLPHTDSDASHIRRSLHDPTAFTVVFERHADPIHRYVARRLGGDVADDLTAETFTVAFRSRRRYEMSRADALPWLYGIATNLIRAHRRSELRRLRGRPSSPRMPVEDVTADRADARLTAEAQRVHLYDALRQLSARHRDVLLLYAWAELDYGEIAAALNIPVGTVRSRLSRARARLRCALITTEGDRQRWMS